MVERGVDSFTMSGSKPSFYCEFCNEEGIHKEAAGICTECNEYLCESCVCHHKRNRLSRHHEILDKDNMPRDKPPSSDCVRRDITTMCQQHKDEPVNYYCQTHIQLACGICYDKYHKSCTCITNITEINSIFYDTEYIDFKKKLKHLENQVHNMIKISRDLLAITKRCCSKVKQFRTKINSAEINSALDKLEHEADDKKYEDVLKIENFGKICSTVLKTIDRISLEFAGLEYENRVCQAYIRLMEAQANMRKMDVQMKKTRDKFDTHVKNMEAFWKISVIDVETKKGQKTSPISIAVSTLSYVQDENVFRLDEDNKVKADLEPSTVSSTASSLDITNEIIQQTSSIVSNSSSVLIHVENVLHTDNADEKIQQKKYTLPNSQRESKNVNNVIIYQEDLKLPQISINALNSQTQDFHDKTVLHLVEENDDKQQNTDPVSNSSALSLHDQYLSHTDKEHNKIQQSTDSVLGSNSSASSVLDQNLSNKDKEYDKIQRNTDILSVSNSSVSSMCDSNLSHKDKEYDKVQRITESVPVLNNSASAVHDQNLLSKEKEYDKAQRNTDSVLGSNISAPPLHDGNRLYVRKKEEIQKMNTSPVSNTLTMSKAVSSASFVQDIYVRCTNDQEPCSVTGSAVLPNSKLVLIDYMNKKIKLVNMQSMMVTCEMKRSGRPWDVTVIKDDQVAVTVWSNKTILFLKVTDTITLVTKIKVSGQCTGIVYSKDQLVVTYVKPPYIEIMDLYGNVNRKLENDKGRTKLFKWPEYVCSGIDGDTLYVSDDKTHRVVSLSRAGSVKAVYIDTDLEYPTKVCLDHRGNMYVCGCLSMNIHMLTLDLTKIKVKLTETDGLTTCVTSVSHCSQTDRLYVGMGCSNVVKVYQLS